MRPSHTDAFRSNPVATVAECHQRVFMAGYHIDRFRAIAISPGFNVTCDIPVKFMAALIADDEVLLDFGLDFLRHTLFGEKFVEEHPDACKKRAQFQQKIALEDDKYSAEHGFHHA